MATTINVDFEKGLFRGGGYGIQRGRALLIDAFCLLGYKPSVGEKALGVFPAKKPMTL